MQKKNTPQLNKSQSRTPPRPRAILEFTKGDLNESPVVYPIGGSAEQDEALRREITKGWE